MWLLIEAQIGIYTGFQSSLMAPTYVHLDCSTLMALKRRSYSKEFVDKKIVFRLRLFLFLFTLMLVIGIYDTSHSYITLTLALFALGIGLIIGFIVGSASNVKWNEEASKVIMKMDIVSGIILVLYIAFAIFKRKIFQHWLKGEELSAFVLCLTAGIMLGRFITIREKVVSVLKRQNKHS